VNGDGLISERELRGVFSHLRALSNEEADKLFREADKDDDGNLAYDEFLDWVMGDEQAHAIVTTGDLMDIRAIIEAAFKATDVNGDGLISERELRGVFSHLRALSNEEADKLFREADKDDDGNLAYGEFLDWVLGDEQAHTIVTTGGLVATPANAARIVPDWSLSVDMHLNVRGQELPRIALYGTTLKSGEELYMAAYANLDAAPDVKDFGMCDGPNPTRCYFRVLRKQPKQRGATERKITSVVGFITDNHKYIAVGTFGSEMPSESSGFDDKDDAGDELWEHFDSKVIFSRSCYGRSLMAAVGRSRRKIVLPLIEGDEQAVAGFMNM